MSGEFVTKRELIQLLDRGNPIEQQVFERFDGEAFSSSDQELKIIGLRTAFELLIPKTVWTKIDYFITNEELNISGFTKDKSGDTQLLLEVEGTSFTTTSDAITQLFTPTKLSTYVHFLLEDTDEHFEMLQENFKYWFYNKLAKDELLVRTVVEDSQYIIRCFATNRYQPIDNHVLLYLTAWALNNLKFEFRLIRQKIDHSSMQLDFMSNENIDVPGVGTLTYGFTVVNSEAKESTVQFHPTCELINKDGTAATMIVAPTISIPHRGSNVEPIISKMQQLEDLKEHARQTAKIATLTKDAKVDELLAYKIQSELIKIVGKTNFEQFSQRYTELSSSNAYNLLEFFGRLSDIPVPDSDKKIEINRLFWKFLKDEPNRNKAK